MGPDHGGGLPDSTAFAQRLQELKAHGSNVLVVGRVTNRGHAAACERLLGDETGDVRRRLFVFTEGTTPCATLPEAAEGENRTRVIVQGSAVDAGPDVSHLPTTSVETGLLSSLGTAIMSTVDEFEEGTDGLAPGEFRLCFDSLAPLLEAHRSENVFRLLHMVTSRVRELDGMGHFHLRVDRDSDPVRLLEPLFDAVVEVRVTNEGVEHQWHLRDGDVSSGWLEL